MVNIANSMQNRFFQKSPAIFDMNNFYIGRQTQVNAVGQLSKHIRMRTGFFGGDVNFGEVPNSKIWPVYSDSFPEGLIVILPFKVGSPGWQKFHDEPFMLLSDREDQLALIQVKIASLVEVSEKINSPEKLKNMFWEVSDMVESMQPKSTQEVPVAAQFGRNNGEPAQEER